MADTGIRGSGSEREGSAPRDRDTCIGHLCRHSLSLTHTHARATAAHRLLLGIRLCRRCTFGTSVRGAGVLRTSSIFSVSSHRLCRVVPLSPFIVPPLSACHHHFETCCLESEALCLPSRSSFWLVAVDEGRGHAEQDGDTSAPATMNLWRDFRPAAGSGGSSEASGPATQHLK